MPGVAGEKLTETVHGRQSIITGDGAQWGRRAAFTLMAQYLRACAENDGIWPFFSAEPEIWPQISSFFSFLSWSEVPINHGGQRRIADLTTFLNGCGGRPGR